MRINRIIIATALAGASAGAFSTSRADAVNDRLNELDQKTRILERKLELADEAAAAKAKEAATVSVGKSGFVIASADKAYQLKIRGYAQEDARFYLNDDDKKANDTFLLRRARIIFDGDLGKNVSFRFAPDYGNGTAQLQDGYFDFKSSEYANLRLGRTKVPLGLERLQSNAETLFVEPGLPTALTPNYDEGALFFGAVDKGLVEYYLGVFNGGADGASVDSDTNDDKDLAARLWLSPFKNSDVDAISGLSFGIAGTFGNQQGTETASGLPTYKTSGQQTFFSYKSSTNSGDTAYADGDRTRYSPQLYYQVGSLGVLSEYVVSEQDVSRGAKNDSIKNDAWQVAVSYVLTGEKPSLKGVEPRNEYDPSSGKWGAFELVARIGELSIDDNAFSDGFADKKKSASSAENVGFGVNWYVNRNFKFVVTYETTTFEDGAATGDRPDEEVILARAQVKF